MQEQALLTRKVSCLGPSGRGWCAQGLRTSHLSHKWSATVGHFSTRLRDRGLVHRPTACRSCSAVTWAYAIDFRSWIYVIQKSVGPLHRLRLTTRWQWWNTSWRTWQKMMTHLKINMTGWIRSNML